MHSNKYPNILRRMYRSGEKYIPFDRRLRFENTFKNINSPTFDSRPTLQLYSHVDNIGNYLPVLGIHQYLSIDVDQFSIHHNIPWDVVNQRYCSIIIGGAGLFHPSFTNTWKSFSINCSLPYVIWGVGACWPNGRQFTEYEQEVLERLASGADLVNVRDDGTAKLIQCSSTSVSACPTLAALDKWPRGPKQPRHILFASHDEMVESSETIKIIKTLKQLDQKILITDNIQRPWCGLYDMINKYYARARVVVTTRLHGAIIAYAMKRPYVCMAHDRKVTKFHRVYGNGIAVEHSSELPDAVRQAESMELTEIMRDEVDAFGIRASAWIHCQDAV